MDIVYNEFLECQSDISPWESESLEIMFVSGEYKPDVRHNYRDVIRHKIKGSNIISITSNVVKTHEKSTGYYIDDLMLTKTYFSKYLLFYDSITKMMIYLKEIPRTPEGLSLRFKKDSLFDVNHNVKDVKLSYNFPKMGITAIPGKHKLVITEPKKEGL